MTDTELNEAVAVKLGWTDLFLSENIGRMDIAGKRKPTDRMNSTVPDYCHSIAAAWEVVEYLSKHYFSVSVSHDDERDLWQCAYEIREDPAIFAIADTAPMAICRAFLKMP